MAEHLDAASFGAFFSAVHGYDPFEWQSRLARRVIDSGEWPQGIDVPTGMGKTALLDVAVFALAAQADRPAAKRTAATRTFMVVDRRLIVDQSFARALQLRDALERAEDGVVAAVARTLCDISGSDTPLEVVRMRGGVTWSARWLRSPTQAAIVVGTADQFGSRLLFRGYGVSTRSRPIDAALAGTDALLILDEAHLSRSAEHTVRTVHQYEARAEQPVLGGRRHRPVLVSATLPDDLSDVFTFDAEAERSPVARRRLETAKHTVLVELANKAKDPSADLARALADLALDGFNDEGVTRLLVVANTVRLARGVFNEIRRRDDRVDAALLTGRCRAYERDRLQEKWDPELQATAEPRSPRAVPLVVVATQTVEVGADYDFDCLVSEAAPMDSLLQRLGRLDRFGHRGASRAVVVYVRSRHEGDPVYGGAVARTWDWLTDTAGRPEPVPAKGVRNAGRAETSLDLGPLAARALLPAGERGRLAADPPDTPEVIGPTLAAWARTEPAPVPDQAPGSFLHGIDRGAPAVTICWRAGLPDCGVLENRAVWATELEATPVSSREGVSVPIWEARRFLAGAPPSAILADVEGEAYDVAFEEGEPVPAAIVLPDGTVQWSREKLAPGCTVVVPSELGGHDRWGWTGVARTTTVVDIADLARRKGRQGLRLRPELLAHLLGGTTAEWRTRVGEPARADGTAAQAKRVAELLLVVATSAEKGAVNDDVAERVRTIAHDLSVFKRKVVRDRWYVVQDVARMTEAASDSTESSSSGGHAPVGLERHLDDVACEAGRLGLALGFPENLVRALCLAGLAHDLGKADPRFQVMLHRGDALRAEAYPELLAKSGMDPADRRALRAAAAAARLPKGMRHEAGSGALLQALAEVAPLVGDGLDFELVLHLVETHHGYGRPLLPPVADGQPVDVEVGLPGLAVNVRIRSDDRIVDWGQPARFERLGRRYGWWGLALLETVVRLADEACSARYDLERVEV